MGHGGIGGNHEIERVDECSRIREIGNRGARIDDARSVRAERGGIARGPRLQGHE